MRVGKVWETTLWLRRAGFGLFGKLIGWELVGPQKGQWTRTVVQGGNWDYLVWKREEEKAPRDSSLPERVHWEERAKLFAALNVGGWETTGISGSERFRLDMSRSILPMRTVKHWSRLLCESCFISVLFPSLNGQIPEQCCLTSELAMVWAGGWSRGLPRSLFILKIILNII